MDKSGDDGIEFRKWCRWGLVCLVLAFILAIVIPSFSAVTGSWCQGTYGVGALFLLLGVASLGWAILSLEVEYEDSQLSKPHKQERLPLPGTVQPDATNSGTVGEG